MVPSIRQTKVERKIKQSNFFQYTICNEGKEGKEGMLTVRNISKRNLYMQKMEIRNPDNAP
ncbi:CLUMA_CG000422, isoform A [Clunio marinus]|uniref:CLUMA_CG000422, isoform A n=1 Tax=Clunio marinus TaxID=568069 RepID=A0A1J1HJ84_9DIPT|nr:CLUMA_CG000422, isoform A [Clunio marinus]